MLGGGTFTTQNKALNGAYINFISASRANVALSERGVAAMPMELDWGMDSAVMTVSASDFREHSRELFGYHYTHEKLSGLRDLFCNGLRTLYCYRLNRGVKADCQFATAKYSGIRGNDLKIVVSSNVDTPSNFDVKTYLGTALVDEQMDVATATDLKDNNYVDFKKSSTLAATAGMPLTGGTNGTVEGTAHSDALTALESYGFHVLGCVATDSTTKALYTAYTKRMRDKVGAKFQTVLHDYAADYEGVINVMNGVNLVYWVVGACACCPVNNSLVNAAYTGEAVANVNYTLAQLEDAMTSGKFALHKVGDSVRVLADVNSLATDTAEKSVELFGENQSVRVLDQIAIDIADLFNTKYLGKIPNDEAGRISLWADIVKHHNHLQDVRAIENFTGDDVIVTRGEKKNSVVIGDAVQIINAMCKLYMTVTVA